MFDPTALSPPDPALFAHLSQSYASARQPLSDFPWPAVVRRAYNFFLLPELKDGNLATAYELQLPESRFERDVIRGLLMCPDATDEAIARCFK